MPTPERFAAEAASYDRWVRSGTDSGEVAVRSALLHVSRLYSAALLLPQPWNDLLAGQLDAVRVDHEEWFGIYTALVRRLPPHIYCTAFAPLVIPPEEAVVGCLADDLADIYRDVVSGLRAYRTGRRASAVWEWGYNFRIHWGDHATNAMRALHAWLAENAPDQLSEDR